MNNFKWLYKNDGAALVDLLRCYQKGHSCRFCSFRDYGYGNGLCGSLDGEWFTIDWLAKKHKK